MSISSRKKPLLTCATSSCHFTRELLIFDECVTLLETARDLYYAIVDQREWIDASGKELQFMTVTDSGDDNSVTDAASAGEPVEDDSSVSNCSSASASTAETDTGWDPETQTWDSEEQKEAAAQATAQLVAEYSEDHCDQETVERIAKEYLMSLDSSAQQTVSAKQKEDPSCAQWSLSSSWCRSAMATCLAWCTCSILIYATPLASVRSCVRGGVMSLVLPLFFLRIMFQVFCLFLFQKESTLQPFRRSLSSRMVDICKLG